MTTQKIGHKWQFYPIKSNYFFERSFKISTIGTDNIYKFFLRLAAAETNTVPI